MAESPPAASAEPRMPSEGGRGRWRWWGSWARAMRRAAPGAGVGALVLLAWGMAWQWHQAQLWPWAGYAVLCVGALVCALAGATTAVPGAAGRALRTAVVLASLLALGFAWAGLRAHLHQGPSAQQGPPAWAGQDVEAVGVIAAMPRVQAGGVRFRFQLESAAVRGQPLAVPQRLDVAWYAPQAQPAGQGARAWPAWRAGDRWRLLLRLREPAGRLNPGLFDYEQWLWLQGVQATAYVREPADVQYLGDAGQFRIERWRQTVRDRITAGLAGPGASAWAQRSAGALAALVTGDQRSIDQADWEVFRTTGVAHLMAISGLHITMFAWLAMAVVGRLWRLCPLAMRWLPAPVAALWGGLLLAATYAVFSGWQLPAQRTVWMLACWVLLRTLGQHWPWHATLALAAAVVLLVEPWALQQAGFWLSFVAVAVLLRLAPGQAPLAPAAALTPAPPSGAAAWLRALTPLALLWQLQWRLSLVLLPLTLAWFGQVGWVGLLANLLAIPLVTWLITPLAMLAALWQPLLPLAGWCMEHLLQALQWLAAWPYAVAHWPRPPWPLVVLAVAGAALVLGRWPLWLRAQALVWLALPLLWRAPAPPSGQFAIWALDVGQGAALVVQTRRHVLLYDAGPAYGSDGSGNAAQSLILPFLQAQGWRPDALVLSHADSDHAGGAATLLAQYPQLPVYASFDPAWAWGEAADEKTGDAAQGRLWQWCQQGHSWTWDGVQWTFLAPSPAQVLRARSAAQPVSGQGRNALSCVLQVRSADGRTALLTGDIGRLQELELGLAYGDGLRADWLQAPHHGSRSSSSLAFLQAVQPRHAVAQTGYANRFGHPHAQVVQRYAQVGVALRTSAQCGAIRWASAQPKTLGCLRAEKPRFWRRPAGQP